MEHLKGFKTILVGGAMVVIPAATQYLGMVDWSFLGPVGGTIASGLVMIGMRLLSNTPFGSKS
jgi:hypothetical protein